GAAGWRATADDPDDIVAGLAGRPFHRLARRPVRFIAAELGVERPCRRGRPGIAVEREIDDAPGGIVVGVAPREVAEVVGLNAESRELAQHLEIAPRLRRRADRIAGVADLIGV